MVSRRRNTPEQQQRVAEFAGLDRRLKAVYERMYRRELADREKIFNRFPAFLVNGIADSRGRSIRSEVVRGWLRERRVFAFQHRRHYHFPAFQFAAGEQKPIIAQSLSLVQPLDGWHAMYWFVGANGWLEAGSPVELLDLDPEAVLEAARHANDEMSD